jgi:excisionase family DNA binding protein
MITVPEAAVRVSRDPETVRRWIRSGKLPAQRVGTQHLIDERDLTAIAEATETPRSLPLPHSWGPTWTGEPMPDWVRHIQRSRRGR